jgi:hypothetical protein
MGLQFIESQFSNIEINTRDSLNVCIVSQDYLVIFSLSNVNFAMFGLWSTAVRPDREI